MSAIKVCLDNTKYSAKPTGAEIGAISHRLGKNTTQLTEDNIADFMENVGNCGQSFCPATFNGGSRNQESFEQQQLFALDFDGTIPHQDVLDRAERYELPVLFSYDTFSSIDHDRFRVVFSNDNPITDRKAAKLIQSALLNTFPEADITSKDISKLYFGGKELLYHSKNYQAFNAEQVFRSMTFYLKDKFKSNHYKEKIVEFASGNGVKLNHSNIIDGFCSDDSTEIPGVITVGKISPIPFIFTDGGENFPPEYYHIKLEDSGGGTSSCSVKPDEQKSSNIHLDYRSSVLGDIRSSCKLYQELESNQRKLSHNELFGIATSIAQVESGAKKFLELLAKNSLYNVDRWKDDLNYNRQSQYKPMNCNLFCPYKDSCTHTSNILTTAKPKVHMIERLAWYKDVFHDIVTVADDVKRAIERALEAEDAKVYVIKAQTSIGKTEIYLQLMSKAGGRWMIAVPTNILKNDILKRAKELGIKVIETPSLDEIYDQIPRNVCKHIKMLYKSGRYAAVYPYIDEVLEKQDIPCLREHLKKLKEVEKFDGHVITTHKRLLNYSEQTLREFEAVIIDEDIIVKNIIPSQSEIPISTLKKELMTVGIDGKLKDKLNKLLLTVKKIKWDKLPPMFELPAFKLDVNDSESTPTTVDAPSLCLSKYFYYRQASEEKNLKEDTIVFFNPVKFKNIKYIMVSATAKEIICQYYFGERKVDFYECKKAKYEGTLVQYYNRSASRHYIDEQLQKHTNVFDKIKARTGIDTIITYKKYNLFELYFGNTEGCNYLAGQDINVVGTPNQIEFLYKLFAYSLHLDFDLYAKMKANVPVTANGYKFRITTFEDEILQSIHLWMNESELEQAVGRARLLRHNCTVNLFSNFPLQQAVLKEFDYDN